MTTPNQPGWYDDPQDANAQRYWDGQDWTPHRQRRPASPSRPPVLPTSHRPAPLPPPPPTVPPAVDYPTAPAWQATSDPSQLPPPAWPPAGPQSHDPGAAAAYDGFSAVKGVVGNLSATAWLLVGGVAITIIATFFPYATVSISAFGSIVFAQQVSLNAASKFAVVLLAALAAGLAWPALSGSLLALWRLIVTSALVGVLAVLMVVWFTNVSGDNREAAGVVDVSPGFGLLLYGAGVVVLSAGVIRLWIVRAQMHNRAY
jgi:hypothetical protein